MDRGMGAPMLVEAAPEIEIREGLFYVTDPSGITRVYRPHVFFSTFRLASEQWREWRVDQSGKVEDIAHWRDQAASS